MKRIYTFLFAITMAMLFNSVYAQCNSNFSYSIDPKDSSVISFYDSSSIKYGSSYWYVNDGTGIVWRRGNYTHQFAKPGTYTVCHYVQDSTISCWDSTCTSITVSFTPKACNANFSEKIYQDKVTFQPHDSTSNYLWTFGDGTSSTYKLPSHTYNIPYNKVMVFNVCLTVYDATKSCSDTVCKNLTFYKQDSCNASFTYSKGSKTVVFTNNSASTSSRVSWEWSFGDKAYSTQKNPTHTYGAFGTRLVCLSLLDSATGCRSTMCDTLIVDTTGGTKCAASFTSAAKDLSVFFTNKSTGATNYSWSFGDGTNSTSKDPFHKYSSPGTYNVCLAISGATCVDSFCSTITVDTSYCKAAFRVGADSSKKFGMRLYNNSSNLGSHEYNWSFGDGTTSTLRNPTHAYSAYGRYYVCLTVTDTFYGCAHTYCDSIGMDSSGKLLKTAFTVTIVEEGTSSISSPESLQAKVYPNPVSSKLYIETKSNAIEVDAKVFNMSGVAVIERENITEKERSIDVQDLPVGLYIIQITDGDKVFRQRFVKSN